MSYAYDTRYLYYNDASMAEIYADISNNLDFAFTTLYNSLYGNTSTHEDVSNKISSFLEKYDELYSKSPKDFFNMDANKASFIDVNVTEDMYSDHGANFNTIMNTINSSFDYLNVNLRTQFNNYYVNNYSLFQNDISFTSQDVNIIQNVRDESHNIIDIMNNYERALYHYYKRVDIAFKHTLPPAKYRNSTFGTLISSHNHEGRFTIINASFSSLQEVFKNSSWSITFWYQAQYNVSNRFYKRTLITISNYCEIYITNEYGDYENVYLCIEKLYNDKSKIKFLINNVDLMKYYVIIYNKGEQKCYVYQDKTLQDGAKSLKLSVNLNNVNIEIGGSDITNHLFGSIQDIRFFNSILDTSNIEYYFNIADAYKSNISFDIYKYEIYDKTTEKTVIMDTSFTVTENVSSSDEKVLNDADASAIIPFIHKRLSGAYNFPSGSVYYNYSTYDQQKIIEILDISTNELGKISFNMMDELGKMKYQSLLLNFTLTEKFNIMYSDIINIETGVQYNSSLSNCVIDINQSYSIDVDILDNLSNRPVIGAITPKFEKGSNYFIYIQDYSEGGGGFDASSINLINVDTGEIFTSGDVLPADANTFEFNQYDIIYPKNINTAITNNLTRGNKTIRIDLSGSLNDSPDISSQNIDYSISCTNPIIHIYWNIDVYLHLLFSHYLSNYNYDFSIIENKTWDDLKTEAIKETDISNVINDHWGVHSWLHNSAILIEKLPVLFYVKDLRVSDQLDTPHKRTQFFKNINNNIIHFIDALYGDIVTYPPQNETTIGEIRTTINSTIYDETIANTFDELKMNYESNSEHYIPYLRISGTDASYSSGQSSWTAEKGKITVDNSYTHLGDIFSANYNRTIVRNVQGTMYMLKLKQDESSIDITLQNKRYVDSSSNDTITIQRIGQYELYVSGADQNQIIRNPDINNGFYIAIRKDRTICYNIEKIGNSNLTTADVTHFYKYVYKNYYNFPVGNKTGTTISEISGNNWLEHYPGQISLTQVAESHTSYPNGIVKYKNLFRYENRLTWHPTNIDVVKEIRVITIFGVQNPGGILHFPLNEATGYYNCAYNALSYTFEQRTGTYGLYNLGGLNELSYLEIENDYDLMLYSAFDNQVSYDAHSSRDSWSLSAWFDLSGLSTLNDMVSIFYMTKTNNNTPFSLRYGNKKLKVGNVNLYNADTPGSETTIDCDNEVFNDFFHIGICVDSGDVNVYINTYKVTLHQSETIKTDYMFDPRELTAIRIGLNTENRENTFRVGDVRIFDYCLSQNQIKDYYLLYGPFSFVSNGILINTIDASNINMLENYNVELHTTFKFYNTSAVSASVNPNIDASNINLELMVSDRENALVLTFVPYNTELNISFLTSYDGIDASASLIFNFALPDIRFYSVYSGNEIPEQGITTNIHSSYHHLANISANDGLMFNTTNITNFDVSNHNQIVYQETYYNGDINHPKKYKPGTYSADLSFVCTLAGQQYESSTFTHTISLPVVFTVPQSQMNVHITNSNPDWLHNGKYFDETDISFTHNSTQNLTILSYKYSNPHVYTIHNNNSIEDLANNSMSTLSNAGLSSNELYTNTTPTGVDGYYEETVEYVYVSNMWTTRDTVMDISFHVILSTSTTNAAIDVSYGFEIKMVPNLRFDVDISYHKYFEQQCKIKIDVPNEHHALTVGQHFIRLVDNNGSESDYFQIPEITENTLSHSFFINAENFGTDYEISKVEIKPGERSRYSIIDNIEINEVTVGSNFIIRNISTVVNETSWTTFNFTHSAYIYFVNNVTETRAIYVRAYKEDEFESIDALFKIIYDDGSESSIYEEKATTGSDVRECTFSFGMTLNTSLKIKSMGLQALNGVIYIDSITVDERHVNIQNGVKVQPSHLNDISYNISPVGHFFTLTNSVSLGEDNTQLILNVSLLDSYDNTGDTFTINLVNDNGKQSDKIDLTLTTTGEDLSFNITNDINTFMDNGNGSSIDKIGIFAHQDLFYTDAGDALYIKTINLNSHTIDIGNGLKFFREQNIIDINETYFDISGGAGPIDYVLYKQPIDIKLIIEYASLVGDLSYRYSLDGGTNYDTQTITSFTGISHEIEINTSFEETGSKTLIIQCNDEYNEYNEMQYSADMHVFLLKTDISGSQYAVIDGSGAVSKYINVTYHGEDYDNDVDVSHVIVKTVTNSQSYISYNFIYSSGLYGILHSYKIDVSYNDITDASGIKNEYTPVITFTPNLIGLDKQIMSSLNIITIGNNDSPLAPSIGLSDISYQADVYGKNSFHIHYMDNVHLIHFEVSDPDALSSMMDVSLSMVFDPSGFIYKNDFVVETSPIFNDVSGTFDLYYRGKPSYIDVSQKTSCEINITIKDNYGAEVSETFSIQLYLYPSLKQQLLYNVYDSNIRYIADTNQILFDIKKQDVIDSIQGFLTDISGQSTDVSLANMDPSSVLLTTYTTDNTVIKSGHFNAIEFNNDITYHFNFDEDLGDQINYINSAFTLSWWFLHSDSSDASRQTIGAGDDNSYFEITWECISDTLLNMLFKWKRSESAYNHSFHFDNLPFEKVKWYHYAFTISDLNSNMRTISFYRDGCIIRSISFNTNNTNAADISNVIIFGMNEEYLQGYLDNFIIHYGSESNIPSKIIHEYYNTTFKSPTNTESDSSYTITIDVNNFDDSLKYALLHEYAFVVEDTFNHYTLETENILIKVDIDASLNELFKEVINGMVIYDVSNEVVTGTETFTLDLSYNVYLDVSFISHKTNIDFDSLILEAGVSDASMISQREQLYVFDSSYHDSSYNEYGHTYTDFTINDLPGIYYFRYKIELVDHPFHDIIPNNYVIDNSGGNYSLKDASNYNGYELEFMRVFDPSDIAFTLYLGEEQFHGDTFYFIFKLGQTETFDLSANISENGKTITWNNNEHNNFSNEQTDGNDPEKLVNNLRVEASGSWIIYNYWIDVSYQSTSGSAWETIDGKNIHFEKFGIYKFTFNCLNFRGETSQKVIYIHHIQRNADIKWNVKLNGIISHSDTFFFKYDNFQEGHTCNFIDTLNNHGGTFTWRGDSDASHNYFTDELEYDANKYINSLQIEAEGNWLLNTPSLSRSYQTTPNDDITRDSSGEIGHASYGKYTFTFYCKNFEYADASHTITIYHIPSLVGETAYAYGWNTNSASDVSWNYSTLYFEQDDLVQIPFDKFSGDIYKESNPMVHGVTIKLPIYNFAIPHTTANSLVFDPNGPHMDISKSHILDGINIDVSYTINEYDSDAITSEYDSNDIKQNNITALSGYNYMFNFTATYTYDWDISSNRMNFREELAFNFILELYSSSFNPYSYIEDLSVHRLHEKHYNYAKLSSTRFDDNTLRRITESSLTDIMNDWSINTKTMIIDLSFSVSGHYPDINYEYTPNDEITIVEISPVQNTTETKKICIYMTSSTGTRGQSLYAKINDGVNSYTHKLEYYKEEDLFDLSNNNVYRIVATFDPDIRKQTQINYKKKNYPPFNMKFYKNNELVEPKKNKETSDATPINSSNFGTHDLKLEIFNNKNNAFFDGYKLQNTSFQLTTYENKMKNAIRGGFAYYADSVPVIPSVLLYTDFNEYEILNFNYYASSFFNEMIKINVSEFNKPGKYALDMSGTLISTDAIEYSFFFMLNNSVNSDIQMYPTADISYHSNAHHNGNYVAFSGIDLSNVIMTPGNSMDISYSVNMTRSRDAATFNYNSNVNDVSFSMVDDLRIEIAMDSLTVSDVSLNDAFTLVVRVNDGFSEIIHTSVLTFLDFLPPEIVFDSSWGSLDNVSRRLGEIESALLDLSHSIIDDNPLENYKLQAIMTKDINPSDIFRNGIYYYYFDASDNTGNSIQEIKILTITDEIQNLSIDWNSDFAPLGEFGKIELIPRNAVVSINSMDINDKLYIIQNYITSYYISPHTVVCNELRTVMNDYTYGGGGYITFTFMDCENYETANFDISGLSHNSYNSLSTDVSNIFDASFNPVTDEVRIVFGFNLQSENTATVLDLFSMKWENNEGVNNTISLKIKLYVVDYQATKLHVCIGGYYNNSNSFTSITFEVPDFMSYVKGGLHDAHMFFDITVKPLLTTTFLTQMNPVIRFRKGSEQEYSQMTVTGPYRGYESGTLDTAQHDYHEEIIRKTTSKRTLTSVNFNEVQNGNITYITDARIFIMYDRYNDAIEASANFSLVDITPPVMYLGTNIQSDIFAYVNNDNNHQETWEVQYKDALVRINEYSSARSTSIKDVYHGLIVGSWEHEETYDYDEYIDRDVQNHITVHFKNNDLIIFKFFNMNNWDSYPDSDNIIKGSNIGNMEQYIQNDVILFETIQKESREVHLSLDSNGNASLWGQMNFLQVGSDTQNYTNISKIYKNDTNIVLFEEIPGNHMNKCICIGFSNYINEPNNGIVYDVKTVISSNNGFVFLHLNNSLSCWGNDKTTLQ